jgi:hypothetical protein
VAPVRTPAEAEERGDLPGEAKGEEDIEDGGSEDRREGDPHEGGTRPGVIPGARHHGGQRLGHFSGRSEPRGRVLGHGFHDDRDTALRSAGRKMHERFRVAVDYGVGQGMLALAMEGQTPGKHFVKDDPERPDVGPGVDVLAADLFG